MSIALQFTDVFSKVYNRHTLKFGGDVNLVHEVMINLFQGGGIYSYSGNVTQEFQNWIADAFAGQPWRHSIPSPVSRYNTFVQTVDQMHSTDSGQAGADDFWMQMYDGFAEDTWKVSPNVDRQPGCALRRPVDAAAPRFPTPRRRSRPNTTPQSRTCLIACSLVSVSPGTHSPAPSFAAAMACFTGLNQGSTYYAMRVENGEYQINYNYNGCNAT